MTRSALPQRACITPDPAPVRADPTLGSLLTPLLPRAYRAALYLTRNPADAEDIVQEAALLAVKGFGGFRPGTNFKAWFMRVLTNVFYRGGRRARVAGRMVALDKLPALLLYAEPESAGWQAEVADPTARFLSELEVAQVGATLQTLPIKYRTIATLYFVDDLSYRQIATMFGCPIGTVRSRLHRARRLLHPALWTLAVDNGIVNRRARPAGLGMPAALEGEPCT